MDLNDTAFPPKPGQVYDRNEMKWVPAKAVPLWKIVVSMPLFWAPLIYVLARLLQWLLEIR